MNTFSILPGLELPQEVIEALKNFDNRNRLIKRFALVAYSGETRTRQGEVVHRLKIYIPSEDRLLWSGYRQTIESQLIEARVCYPDFNMAQELAWRQLKQVLCQFRDHFEVDGALFDVCRTATLNGWIDGLEGKLPLATYLRCKSLIGQIGDGLFEKDFTWYFGEEVPDDHYRGLEGF